MPDRFRPITKGASRDARGRPLLEQPSVAAGAGFTAAVGGFLYRSIERAGNIWTTRYLLDLTGTHSTAAGDIIGVDNNASPAYLGRILTAESGTIVGGRVICIETPAGGEPDIDVWSATEATGIEDAAGGSTLTETVLMDAAADWTAATASKGMANVPAANEYIYLIASGGGDNAVYTAGKFLIEFYGYAT